MRIALVAVLIVAVVAYIALFDPVVYPAPRCLFNALTGWDCPGCGTQRALHALFEGKFVDAWRFNPAFFVGMFLAGLYAISPRRWRGVMYSPAALWGIVAAIVLWWVLRNVL